MHQDAYCIDLRSEIHILHKMHIYINSRAHKTWLSQTNQMKRTRKDFHVKEVRISQSYLRVLTSQSKLFQNLCLGWQTHRIVKVMVNCCFGLILSHRFVFWFRLKVRSNSTIKLKCKINWIVWMCELCHTYFVSYFIILTQNNCKN